MSHEAFNYLGYVFIFFIIILAGLFIAVTFLKKNSKYINWFSVVSISLICIVVSALNMVLLGYAADEINLQAVNYSYMFIAIIILAALDSIIAFKNK